MNENYDEWMNKEAGDQIRDLMMNKDQEDSKEVEKMKRMEKAKSRRKLWKEWRNNTADEERDQVLDEGAEEGVVQAHHPGEAVGEPPGQGNSPQRTGELPTNIGEEEPVKGGAYEEISRDGTAPCKAGPHIHQGDEPEQPAHKARKRLE